MDFNYIIWNEHNKPIIEIVGLKLKPLQDLLNTLCVYSYLEEVIDEFKMICKESSNLENLIENKFNGYWEDDLLGSCFTVLGYDNGIDVFVNDKVIYIEDEYQYPKVPRVKLDIREFIQILENWRGVLKLHS